MLALATAMVAAGFGQRWAVRHLLRAEPSRMLEELGRRQTLALELHDAVGHALSIVLVQGMAAQAALQRPAPRPDALAGSPARHRPRRPGVPRRAARRPRRRARRHAPPRSTRSTPSPAGSTST
ncbi:histidine kinase [Nonomuraea sp. NPDC049758]|uniref:histidine kinase n=1 Tax=Nonomuraea sp. NPDC049758 TaxID=3154360 RepID=UPI00343A6523